MFTTRPGYHGIAALAIGFLFLTLTGRASDVVLPGWDLLRTDAAGTVFAGQNWQGVPLLTYDFGGTIGPKGVGPTDTVVQRLALAAAPSSAIPIELVALQLETVAPADLGAGLGSYFLTLQSARGGPASVGQMTVSFGSEGQPHGAFDSFFDVFFDVRFGSLSGPIVLSDSLLLQSSGTPWQHEPAGPLVIDGVNHNLNGSDEGRDFWPVGPIQESHPSGARHTVVHTPEPHEVAVTAALGLVGFALVRRLAHK